VSDSQPSGGRGSVPHALLFSRDRFEQGIEVLNAGVFDDDATLTIFVFDTHFES
jgi:hypothetical protein